MNHPIAIISIYKQKGDSPRLVEVFNNEEYSQLIDLYRRQKENEMIYEYVGRMV